jgi:peptide/nickel transport system permease protein
MAGYTIPSPVIEAEPPGQRAASLTAPIAPAQRASPLRSIAMYAVTVWVVGTVIFLLPRAIPGDPLQRLQDPDSTTFVDDPVARSKVAAYYGLDKPLIEQYGSYVADVVGGDLGWSISQNAPVRTLIDRRLPWTLLLVGTSLVLAACIGFVAGVTAAWRRRSAIDRGLIVSLSIVNSIPEYAIASLLLFGFAVSIPLFPQAGAQTAFARYPTPFDAAGDIIHHMVLPVTALTLGIMANQFLIVRNTVVSTLGEDFMLLARAKGLPRRVLKYRHAGRNALLPFVTAVGASTPLAVGPALFVEVVFAYPGMGSLLSGSVTARDYPLLQGGFLAFALFVLTVNLVLDLVYRRIDPRVQR